MTKDSSTQCQSFIYVTDLALSDLNSLLQRAAEIKTDFKEKRKFPRSLKKQQIVLLFAEASTRTRLSFQMAAQRMGAQCLLIENNAGSSMSKGETFADTFWTAHANQPDAIVVRCDKNGDLDQLAKTTGVPIINGGFGAYAHPTQALLDAMTLLEYRETLTNQKILFVGDIKHSRVFSSHRRLLPLLGAELGVCAPAELFPDDCGGLVTFDNLDKALEWTSVYCGLRVQFERHGDGVQMAKEKFIKEFSLNRDRLTKLARNALIIHPGPVNWGIEFQEEVQKDHRLLMWQQKENSVYLRAALLEKMIGRER